MRAERGSDVIIMLVANKIDLADRRKVTLEELQKKAQEEGVMYMETSAKAGYNVRAMFAEIGYVSRGFITCAFVSCGGCVCAAEWRTKSTLGRVKL